MNITENSFGKNFHDHELEQTVLGMFLKQDELLLKTKLKELDFHEPTHQEMFGEMFILKNTTDLSIDPFTLNQTNKNLSMRYMIELRESCITTENFTYFEKQLIELSNKRKSVLIVHDAKQALVSGENPEEVLTDLESKIQEINQTNNVSTLSRSQRLNNYFHSLESRDGTLKGCDWGYDEVNRMTKGLVATKLIILAARPSMGKSAFALNVAKYVSVNDVVAFFSLEMPEEDNVERLVSSITNIASERFQNTKNNFEMEDWKNVLMAIETIKESGLHIFDDPNVNVLKIRQKVKELQKQYPDKRVVVMIDYLQLIRPVKPKGNREQEVSEISRELKLLAMELKVPVVALSQLSRSVESRQDKRPMLSDLRESGSIEQDADIVAFLYRDDYYDKNSESKNIVEIILAKNRDGKVGTINLAFVKEYSKFLTLER